MKDLYSLLGDVRPLDDTPLHEVLGLIKNASGSDRVLDAIRINRNLSAQLKMRVSVQTATDETELPSDMLWRDVKAQLDLRLAKVVIVIDDTGGTPVEKPTPEPV